ncbi:MAG: hypothetical protein ACO3P9_06395, partial [Phycisphaerales bacterium]
HHITQVPGGPGSETITAKAIMENIVAQRSARRANMFHHVVVLDARRGDSPAAPSVKPSRSSRDLTPPRVHRSRPM